MTELTRARLPYNKVYSTDDAAANNAAAGYHFFKPDSMRFFSSRISGYQKRTSHGLLFITSEQDKYTGGPRKYTVRFYADDDATVRTVGEFMQHRTLANARRALDALKALDYAGGLSGPKGTP